VLYLWRRFLRLLVGRYAFVERIGLTVRS